MTFCRCWLYVWLSPLCKEPQGSKETETPLGRDDLDQDCGSTLEIFSFLLWFIVKRAGDLTWRVETVKGHHLSGRSSNSPAPGLQQHLGRFPDVFLIEGSWVVPKLLKCLPLTPQDFEGWVFYNSSFIHQHALSTHFRKCWTQRTQHCIRHSSQPWEAYSVTEYSVDWHEMKVSLGLNVLAVRGSPKCSHRLWRQFLIWCKSEAFQPLLLENA